LQHPTLKKAKCNDTNLSPTKEGEDSVATPYTEES